MPNTHTDQHPSTQLATVLLSGQTADLRQSYISSSDSPLNSVLQSEGWRLLLRDGIAHLDTGSVTVRYYDYPPEKYNLEVRRMILINTLSELQEMLGIQEAPTGLLMLIAKEWQLKTEVNSRDFRATERGIQERVEQQLAITRFQLGGQILLKFLENTIASGCVDFALYHQGIDYIASAHNLAEFAGLKILHRSPSESHNVQRKLARNIRDIVDIEEPIEPLITVWYRKIAHIKETLQSLVAVLVESCASAELRQKLMDYGQASAELLEARRNEPEYQQAIQGERQAYHQISGQGFDTEIDRMRWIALVREPLEPGIFSL